MATQAFDTRVSSGGLATAGHGHSHASAVAWGAIFAGAVTAVGVTVILMALGSGLGFGSLSPWPDRGVSATTFTVTTAISVLVTQWISASIGGYLAGRLRVRWSEAHHHEVFFRDTAHGFITWALATVVMVTLALLSASNVAGGGVHAVADAASAHAGAMSANPAPAGADNYAVDKLFRPPSGAPVGDESPESPGNARAQVAHIAANAVTTGAVSDADRAFLGHLVAERTGAAPADAQRRADDFVSSMLAAETKAKAEADRARKAAAEASFFLALSLLVGAFIASVSAALGGRLREHSV
ncbi:MAG: hypothetical protein M3O06_06790 [Pseudomonadota bacterium]|nr:hypothetical protein [Pseudomonadota bacterium]